MVDNLGTSFFPHGGLILHVFFERNIRSRNRLRGNETHLITKRPIPGIAGNGNWIDALLTTTTKQHLHILSILPLKEEMSFAITDNQTDNSNDDKETKTLKVPTPSSSLTKSRHPKRKKSCSRTAANDKSKGLSLSASSPSSSSTSVALTKSSPRSAKKHWTTSSERDIRWWHRVARGSQEEEWIVVAIITKQNDDLYNCATLSKPFCKDNVCEWVCCSVFWPEISALKRFPQRFFVYSIDLCRLWVLKSSLKAITDTSVPTENLYSKTLNAALLWLEEERDILIKKNDFQKEDSTAYVQFPFLCNHQSIDELCEKSPGFDSTNISQEDVTAIVSSPQDFSSFFISQMMTLFWHGFNTTNNVKKTAIHCPF